MDEAEKKVEQLLTQMGFSGIRHEPNGKSTFPDFDVHPGIAVEVRRLNQNHETNGSARGLEETSIPLRQGIEQLCKALGTRNEPSWFLCYSFTRPLTPWKGLKPKLEACLRAFMHSPSRQAALIYEDSSFSLEAVQASSKLDTFFHLGAMTDHQAGGWVVAEFLKNIEHCIRVKTARLASCSGEYAARWLFLVNVTGLRLDEHDKGQLLEHVSKPPQWDRVVVVEACRDGEWFDVGEHVSVCPESHQRGEVT